MSRHPQAPTPIDPAQDYVFLRGTGAADLIEGGAKFWSLPPAQLERFGHGWLVAEFVCDADWTDWEMHPEADEVVYLLDGDAELLLEQSGDVHAVRLAGRGLVVVPRGAWHTLKVASPSRLLHVTMGAGTRRRPVGESRRASAFELAQFNLGRTRGALDAPVMAGFASSLERINAAADAAPGFVWRLTGEAGDAAAAQYLASPHAIGNLSVWRDLGSLRRYVYESGHLDMLRRRREWFERVDPPYQVLWWIPRGHRPDAAEALERLARLRGAGPGPEAFDFARAYPAPDDGTPVASGAPSG